MRAIAVVVGLLSAFFVFYTVRLLVVTQALQHTRAGGQGAYVGAVVFPILALAFGWASWRFWRLGSGRTHRFPAA
jgi:multisubunit Na+/H+ antiporter MnhB subunit